MVVFVGGPLAVRWWVPPAWWPYLLAAVALPALVAGGRRPRAAWRHWLGPLRTLERAWLGPMLVRFGLCTAALLAAIAWLLPERLFDLPQRHTTLWAVLLVSYPIFSVYPQELIYRHFYRLRYRALFAGRDGWIASSALAFAWLHIVFDNVLAVALTLIGGWFFSQTYRASGSLRLVVLEHSLYGAVIFTIGTGQFFHSAFQSF